MLLTHVNLEVEGESCTVYAGKNGPVEIEVQVIRTPEGVEIIVFNEAKQIIEKLDVTFSEAKDRS